MLSMLPGHKRYSHIAALRGDGVARHRTTRRRIARPVGHRELCIGCSTSSSKTICRATAPATAPKTGRRPPLRARPPARQQIQREHQNRAQISELEYPVPPQNPADELTVNLDSGRAPAGLPPAFPGQRMRPCSSTILKQLKSSPGFAGVAVEVLLLRGYR